MGQPVVHFEVVGKDGDKLQSFYSELFEWEINADNPMNYGTVERYTRPNGVGIGLFTHPEGHVIGLLEAVP